MEAATPTRGQKNISVLRKVSNTPQCACLLHLKEMRGEEERRGEEMRGEDRRGGEDRRREEKKRKREGRGEKKQIPNQISR